MGDKRRLEIALKYVQLTYIFWKELRIVIMGIMSAAMLAKHCTHEVGAFLPPLLRYTREFCSVGQILPNSAITGWRLDCVRGGAVKLLLDRYYMSTGRLAPWGDGRLRFPAHIAKTAF